MDRGTKYQLLTRHFVPSFDYKSPETYDKGLPPLLSHGIHTKSPLTQISPRLDGAFCVPCALFAADRSNKEALVTIPFNKWARYTNVIVAHAEKQYHRDAMLAAKAFCETMENSTATIQCHVSTEREKRVKENRKLLQLIVKAVLYCGRQCIALQGDKERLDQPGNPGNFRALLKLMSEDNDMLAQHLRNANRVTYIFPQSQIEVIGKKLIQTRIAQEIM